MAYAYSMHRQNDSKEKTSACWLGISHLGGWSWERRDCISDAFRAGTYENPSFWMLKNPKWECHCTTIWGSCYIHSKSWRSGLSSALQSLLSLRPPISRRRSFLPAQFPPRQTQIVLFYLCNNFKNIISVSFDDVCVLSFFAICYNVYRLKTQHVEDMTLRC